MTYDYSDLIGRTIKSIRNMTEGELEELEWSYGIVLTLDDETTLTVAEDDDNQNPGSLFHWSKNQSLISVYS